MDSRIASLIKGANAVEWLGVDVAAGVRGEQDGQTLEVLVIAQATGRRSGEDEIPGCVDHAVGHFRRERAELADLGERFQSLTPREREVMQLVVTGLLNKQIAAELGTSEVTVKAHRRQVMQKMRAGSLAQLVRIAGKLATTALPQHGANTKG